MKKLYTVVYYFIFLLIVSFSQNAIAQFPTIAVSNPTVTEGTAAVFVISLSNPWTSPITMSIATTTMTAGSADFTNVATQVTIPTGATSTTVTVQTTADNIHEPNETFVLTASPFNGSTSPPVSMGTCTIINTGGLPFVSITNVTVVEGQTAVFVIALSAPSSTQTSIVFGVTAGTAGSTDFSVQTIPSIITIPANATSVAISVPTIDDSLIEGTETFMVSATMNSTNFANTIATATCTIIDNDMSILPTISIANATALEGTSANFVIALSNPSSVTTVINITTTTGTAGSMDYAVTATQVTIPAGQTSTFVPVYTIGDIISEGTETFTLTGTVISGNTSNLVATATGRIIDNTSLPMISISNITANEGATATFIITTSVPASTPIIITFQAIPGTATALDYAFPNINTATIPAGATLTTFSIPILNDNIFEVSETFVLQGTINSQNTSNSLISVTCTIVGQATLVFTNNPTYSDFNIDGFTNVGDVINCQFTLSNISPFVLTNVSVSSNQIAVTGTTIPNLPAASSNTSAFSGIYVLTQTDINNNFATISASSTANVDGQSTFRTETKTIPLNISKGFKLNAFMDTNQNGMQDSAEPNVNYGTFKYQMNNGVVHNIFASSGVFYLYESVVTNIYILSYSLPSSIFNSGCYNQYTVMTPLYNNVTISAAGIVTYNFAIVPTVCSNTSVYLWGEGAPPRPGFTYNNVVYFSNQGNQTISSGTVTFVNSSTVSILSTSLPSTPTTNGFVHNFTNLLPGQIRSIIITMQVPVIPTVSLGQIVTNSVTISIPPNDINTLNNAATFSQVIVGSYDPNDKVEFHGPKILHSTFTTNDFLTYKIQFENTGTASAINVRITDALSSKLNENSLQMIDASHPYVLDRTGSNLEWKFAGINLPPSVANTQIGHGHVVFQIKPKVPYAIGDIIANTANIFFDFNPAIVTNTFTTEFVALLDNASFGFEKLKVYPNPTKNILTIENNQAIQKLTFTNMLGQTVLEKTVNDLHTQTDLAGIANGVYFVKISTAANEKVMKFVKE